MLPARPLPEEDPFLEACLAMEEGRCDENVQGQLKTVREKLAKEQSSHAKTESLVWKMGYWLRRREADLERASFKHSRAQQHIKAMQSDRKELKNPCVLFKERIRRGQCQHVVKQATVARETVMMRKFSSSTMRCPDTKLISALIPAGAASYKLLACQSQQSQLVIYVDLLGAAGRINVGRSLQEALVKEAVSAGCCLIFLRALPTAYRFWSHAGFTRNLEASQQNCLRNLGLLDWLGAVDRDCVRLVKFL